MSSTITILALLASGESTPLAQLREFLSQQRRTECPPPPFLYFSLPIASWESKMARSVEEEAIATVQGWAATLKNKPALVLDQVHLQGSGVPRSQASFSVDDDNDGGSLAWDVKDGRALEECRKQLLGQFANVTTQQINLPSLSHVSIACGRVNTTLLLNNVKEFASKVAGLNLEIDSLLVCQGQRIIGRSFLCTPHVFRFSLFIDGEWTHPQPQAWGSFKTIPVVNPSSRETIHTIAGATAADVDKAVEAAKRAFPLWASKTPAQRAEYLLAIAQDMENRKEQLIELEVIDNGKPKGEANEDINDAISCFRYYAKMIVEREEETKVEGVHKQFECSVRREPVGVCALIIPWNYPILMLAWKVAPCLAAGCTAVLKPSELTSLNALEFAGVCTRVGLPAGVLNVCPGYGADAGEPLSKHPDVQKVAFTGSVATGTKVLGSTVDSLKRCSLELGGKSPIIVFDDADVEQAVDWITVGIFFNAGQVCSATSRLIVQRNVKEKLLKRLVEVAKQIQIGDGLKEGTKLGPLVNDTQYNKVLNYIRKGLDRGATLLCGGIPTSGPLLRGYFVPPTVFDNVTPSMEIWKEEIFGPVLSVITFDHTDEAIRLANNTEYGLAAAIFSKDVKLCQQVSKQLNAGIVWINCSQPTFVQLPWGGMKKSGFGRELGPWGLDNYTELKQVTTWADPSSKGWEWFSSKL